MLGLQLLDAAVRRTPWHVPGGWLDQSDQDIGPKGLALASAVGDAVVCCLPSNACNKQDLQPEHEQVLVSEFLQQCLHWYSSGA